MPTIDTSICEQIRCGAITQEMAGSDTLLQCALAGYVGSRNCSDPVCKPWVPQIRASGSGQGLQCPAPVYHTDTTPIYIPSPGTPAAAMPGASMPRATETALPAIVTQARVNSVVAGEVANSSILNPQALLSPLPQIVPSPVMAPMPQVCDAFTSWVTANPFLAALGLVAAFFMVTRK